jgi:hypothetical protein
LVRQWARAPQGAATVTETSEQRIRQLERELRDLEQQLQREADLG